MSPPPLFSVVVATYNRAELLGAVRGRLERQDEPSFELIVVNDGSTDATAEVLDSWSEPWIRTIHQPNGGLSAARNRGASAATGVTLVFLDDDDRPHHDWLSTFASMLVQDDAAVASVGSRLVNPQGTVLETRAPRPLGPAFGDVTCSLPAGTVAMSRSYFERVGGFDVEQPTSHQTELLLRLLPLVADDGLVVRSVARPTIDLVRDDELARRRSDPARLLAGTERIIDRHIDRLQRDPRLLASYAAIAGTAAARGGDLTGARRWFARAARADPRQPRHLGRLVTSCIPPLAHRRWPR